MFRFIAADLPALMPSGSTRRRSGGAFLLSGSRVSEFANARQNPQAVLLYRGSMLNH
jgi:hypothetical protein